MGPCKQYGIYSLNNKCNHRGQQRRPGRHRCLYPTNNPALRTSLHYQDSQGGRSPEPVRRGPVQTCISAGAISALTESRGSVPELARMLGRASWKRCHLSCLEKHEKTTHSQCPQTHAQPQGREHTCTRIRTHTLP